MNDAEIYILNPAYTIRADKKRIILYCSPSWYPIKSYETSEFLGFLHPIFAIILSSFDGENGLKSTIQKAAELLLREYSEILTLASPLIENEEGFNFMYDGVQFYFPKKLIIKKTPDMSIRKMEMGPFLIPRSDLDFKSLRLYAPLDILFMINTKCATDCIYCYADRGNRMDLQITWERLKEIIQEAKAIGIRSFDITGGEFFYYENWELLLKELMASGFTPYITTKIPITTAQIAKLKELGLPRMQISLDSIIKEELSELLKVDENYCERIKKTILDLDEAGIDIFINSQLTKINKDSIEQLFRFLLDLKNIKKINVGAAGYSLYKDKNFPDYKVDVDTVKRVEELVDRLKLERKDVTLNFSGVSRESEYINDFEEKKKSFNQRARCSANFYALIILPDGSVTICEELYFNPQFIIGDLNSNSLMDVWNSPKALGLYHLTKEEFRVESACTTCETFDGCHKYKGVCWKQVLYAYGTDNWDYPDPRCPHAPKPMNEFYI